MRPAYRALLIIVIVAAVMPAMADDERYVTTYVSTPSTPSTTGMGYIGADVDLVVKPFVALTINDRISTFNFHIKAGYAPKATLQDQMTIAIPSQWHHYTAAPQFITLPERTIKSHMYGEIMMGVALW